MCFVGFSHTLAAVINCRRISVRSTSFGASGELPAFHNPSNCSNGVRVEDNPLYTPSGVHPGYPCRDPEMGFSRFLVAVITCRRMGVRRSFLGASGECAAFHNPSNCPCFYGTRISHVCLCACVCVCVCVCVFVCVCVCNANSCFTGLEDFPGASRRLGHSPLPV